MTGLDPLLLDSPAAMPCTHPRAQHYHGTKNAYQFDRCRCLACREAKNAYERHRTRQIAYGRWTAWADAEPARAQVLRLMRDAGIGWQEIAVQAGLAEQTVEMLLFGIPRRGIPRSVRIRHSTAEKLGAAVGLWPTDWVDHPKRSHKRKSETEGSS